jgi:hypothetical protein
MQTKIYLDFTEKTRLGRFIKEKEIDQLNEFYYGILDVSHINIIPRIGETFNMYYEGYGYQEKLLKEIEKDGTKPDLFNSGGEDEEKYIVKDVAHSFGRNNIGDIHFINVLLCVG